MWSADEKENFWSAGEKKNIEEKRQEYFRKTNIWSAKEKKSREGKDDKHHGKGKSNDRQTDRQTTFPFVDSAPSVEGVESTTFLIS